jgi:hypothetical protein
VRGNGSALIAAACACAVALSAPRAQAQLFRKAQARPAVAGARPPDSALATPPQTGRGARQLLRNGLDYLDTYNDPGRAAAYLEEARRKQADLTEPERRQLAQALARLRQAQDDDPGLAGGPARAPAPTQLAYVSTRPQPTAPAEARSRPPADDPSAGLAQTKTDLGLRTTAAHAQTPAPAEPSASAAAEVPPIGLSVLDEPAPAPLADAPPPVIDATPVPELPQAAAALAEVPATPAAAAPAPESHADTPEDAPRSAAPAPAPEPIDVQAVEPPTPDAPAAAEVPFQPESIQAIPVDPTPDGPDPATEPPDATPSPARARPEPAPTQSGRSTLLLPPPAPRPPQALSRLDGTEPHARPAPAGDEPEPEPAPDANELPPLPQAGDAMPAVVPDAPAPLPVAETPQPETIPAAPEPVDAAPAVVIDAPAPDQAARPAPPADDPAVPVALAEPGANRTSSAVALPEPPPALALPADDLPTLPGPAPVADEEDLDEETDEPMPALPVVGRASERSAWQAPDHAAADDLPPLPTASVTEPPPPNARGLLRADGANDHPPIEVLRPETRRMIEEVARRQDAESRSRAMPFTSSYSRLDDTTDTEAELPRAPAPTEAVPIRPIPVPEDYVPLAQRQFAPRRKYWAPSGVCYMPLYFQDAVLERYGQSAEQAVGPHWGRFLSYPLDDPRQTIQRNQILQPAYSAGLFIVQLAAWPYNMIVDPPWEAQYDLGYYRPGDPIPPDSYYWPRHGLGPPLRGRKY